MHRTALAAALAAALALAPAAPARADTGEGFLGLLLGIGVVHAIGKGIERARLPTPPRPSPVQALAADPCAGALSGDSRGPGLACVARGQGGALAAEAWHDAPYWYGADRVRP